MNERIRVFAEQCYEKHELLDTYEFNKEKFAELIVQECAGIAKHHVMNISTYADADFVEVQINQHFGVER